MLRSIRWLAFASLLGLVAGASAGQDETGKDKAAKEGKGAEDKAPKTAKVKKGLFQVEVSAKGMLEAKEMREVIFRRHTLTGPAGEPEILTITKIAEHGTPIKKGATILQFDTRRIDWKIKSLEMELRNSDQDLAALDKELPILEKTVPLDLKLAERAKKLADDDLKHFREVDRPHAEKDADFELKVARFRLDSAKEELRQVEKMYKANDLTEETEQIILKRQKFYVEAATYNYKETERLHGELLKRVLPRREQTLVESADKQDLLWQKARDTLPHLISSKRLSEGRLIHEREKLIERLESLRKDRAAMTVEAVSDGVVYHGKCSRGEWHLSGAQSDKLEPGGNVQPDEVLLTIVKARPLCVRLLIDEADARHIKPGLTGKVQTSFLPDLRLAAKVDKIASAPTASGKFEAVVTLEPDKTADALMPGMSCKVKFVPVRKEQVVSVPSAAVFTDDEDDRSFVWLARKGKHERRFVQTGLTSGGRTEIIEGLNGGEEILLERPEDKKEGQVMSP